MEPLEATPFWVTVDELDIGIDTFTLVIRLSGTDGLTVDQPFELSRHSCCPLRTLGMIISLLDVDLNSQKLYFYRCSSSV